MMAEGRDELRGLYPFLHGGHKDRAEAIGLTTIGLAGGDGGRMAASPARIVDMLVGEQRPRIC